ncbi:MAG: hypothetical protein ABIV42_03890 [Nitrosospira sp.]
MAEFLDVGAYSGFFFAGLRQATQKPRKPRLNSAMEDGSGIAGTVDVSGTSAIGVGGKWPVTAIK